MVYACYQGGGTDIKVAENELLLSLRRSYGFLFVDFPFDLSAEGVEAYLEPLGSLDGFGVGMVECGVDGGGK
jgi:hypothetical protein